MKLRSLMKEYLDREVHYPYNIDNIQNVRKSKEFPCEVSGNSNWSREDEKSIRNFSFPCRSSLKSFCEYLLDLEGETGMFSSFHVKARTNDVEVTAFHSSFGEKNLSFFLKQVDNIYQDVVGSFKNV